MNGTFRVSEQNREGGRRTAFPIAAVFALLSSLTLSVWFIVNLLTRYDYYREARILWTLIPQGLMVLLWIVMTICLLMRKRNAVPNLPRHALCFFFQIPTFLCQRNI